MEKVTETDAKRIFRRCRGRSASASELKSLMSMTYKEAWRSQFARGSVEGGYFEQVDAALDGTAALRAKLDKIKEIVNG